MEGFQVYESTADTTGGPGFTVLCVSFYASDLNLSTFQPSISHLVLPPKSMTFRGDTSEGACEGKLKNL